MYTFSQKQQLIVDCIWAPPSHIAAGQPPPRLCAPSTSCRGRERLAGPPAVRCWFPVRFLLCDLFYGNLSQLLVRKSDAIMLLYRRFCMCIWSKTAQLHASAEDG